MAGHNDIRKSCGKQIMQRGIVWTGSQFAATGNTGTIFTSPDGITWIVRPSPGTANLNGIVWSPDLSRSGVVGATGSVYTSL